MLLKLRLILLVLIWLHSCNTLETAWFIYTEDYDDVISWSDCLLQLSSWLQGSCPNFIFNWQVYILLRVWLQNVKASCTFENWGYTADVIAHLTFILVAIRDHSAVTLGLYSTSMLWVWVCAYTLEIRVLHIIGMWGSRHIWRELLLWSQLIVVHSKTVIVTERLVELPLGSEIIACQTRKVTSKGSFLRHPKHTVVKSLCHLFHKSLNHIDVGNLTVIEVSLHFL